MEEHGGWRRESRTGVATGSGEQIEKIDTKDSESLPYFQQRRTMMMVNIVKMMRQELGLTGGQAQDLPCLDP